MKGMLRTGDEVLWRDGWGTDAEVKAKVIRIERLPRGNPEEGEVVQLISWDEVRVGARAVMVMMDTGKWGYGGQIREIEDTAHLKLAEGAKYTTRDGFAITVMRKPKATTFFATLDGGNTRHFTETGGCIAYYRGNTPIVEEDGRSIDPSEIERVNKGSSDGGN